MQRTRGLFFAPLSAILLVSACQPVIRLEAPDKPIVINMNIKIEQDVRVRVEKDVAKTLETNPDLF